ncbi:hypothetical protein ACOMHN_001135 [Nucella lapillus]
MGCGGSKNDVQTDSDGELKKKTGKEGSPKKSDPHENKRADKSKDGDDSNAEAVNNKKANKEEQVRQELVLATESRDMGRLEKAIADYERSQLPNTSELARARRVLASLHEQELQEAMEEEKLDRLEAAIDAANNSTVSPELHDGETLQEAEELRRLLRRLKLYMHKILELKPMTVSEIHSYKLMVPPFLQPHPDLQSAVGNAPLSSKHPAQLPTTDCLLSIISPMGGQPSDAPALSPPSPLQQGGQSSNAPALSPPSPLPQGGQPIALALSPPSPPPQGGQPSDAPGLSPSSSTLLLCPSDSTLNICHLNSQSAVKTVVKA